MAMDSEGIKVECSKDWKASLNERDINVCQIVCHSRTPMGFNEIRRQTAIHQEILSRILKRLQFRGYIEKIQAKYYRCCYSSQ